MACLRTPSTSSTPNAFEPMSRASLKYHGVHSQRAIDDRPSCTIAPRLRSTRRPTSSGLGRADGVVDDVDAARPRDRQALPRPAQHAAGPRRERLDERIARLGSNVVAPSSVGQRLLRGPAGDGGDLDVGVQRPQDGGGARAEGAGAVDDGAAARRRRRAGDGVERDRERVGEDGDLVGDVVGHGHEHAAVGREQLGEAAGGVGRVAGVDAGREVAVVEVPAQAVVAGLARRARAGRCRGPRTTATG